MKLHQLWKTLALCSVVSSSVFAETEFLSPPWYILQRQVKASIGADPCVNVKDLDTKNSVYVLEVQVTCNAPEKMAGLATMLTREINFGGVHVNVIVTDMKRNVVAPIPFPTSNPEAAQFINSTLTGNPYYVDVVAGTRYYKIFVEFRKLVVQFYADNIADKYGNHNRVAAESFKDVIDFPKLSEIKIGTTTSPRD